MTKYVQEKVATMEHPATAWALCGLIAMLALTYAYFVNLSIGNVVAAKDIESRVSSLSSQVSALESRYIALKSAVSPDDAPSLGMAQAAAAPVYIAKASERSLSFNR
jgi:hypothetical protein